MVKGKDRIMKGNYNKIFFYTFVSLWAVFIVWNLATPKKVFSQNENRYLSEFPKYTHEKLLNGEYMGGMDKYINDQVLFRDKWISIKTIVERAILKQDINSVYFGKDGYLIEKHMDSDVSKEQADKNRERLIEFVKKYSKKLGEDKIKVMLIPTASEILTDKLPPFATGYDQNGYMDRVVESLSKGVFIDVRENFKKLQKESIYYRTDHHWTSLGAYYAYEQWAKESGLTPISQEEFNKVLASDEFYGTLHSKVNRKVKADEIYLYKIKKDIGYELLFNLTDKKDSLYDFSKLEGKDKYAVFLGGNNAVVEIQTNNHNGRKLLVLKDSFAHSFTPFAVNHFEETHMLDFRYFNGSIEQYMEENEITDVLVLYNTINFVKDKNSLKFVK